MRQRYAMVHWFRNQRIRTKIFAVYIPLILIPLFILGYTSNSIYSNAIIDKTKRNVSDNSSLIITRLNGMLTNAESCANMLTLSLNRPPILNLLMNAAEPSDLQRYTAITNELSFGLLVFPEVESAAFVDEQGRVYGSTSRMEGNAPIAARSSLVQEISTTNGLNVWIPMQQRDFLVTDKTIPVLTLGKKIVNINTGQTLGVLVLNLRESSLSSVYRNMDALPQGSYFIADREGNVVSSAEPKEVLRPIADPNLQQWVQATERATDIRPLNGRDMLVASHSFPQLGWKLVSVIPLRELTAELAHITLIILAVGAMCCLFALAGAGLLSKLIASPIIRLAKAMKGFHEGNLDIRLQVNSADEMGLFSAGFNTMTQRIKELVHNITQEQKKKREYELALVQAQIKPHFLYNTLDVIYALSEMGRSKDVSKATKALADFYRVALSKGRERIKIEEELRNVKDYLAIQHVRYSDVFTYAFEVDSDVLPHEIPKLTIQPLVENAIYHGLKEKGDVGRLLIRGYRRGASTIVMEVADDGVGMTQDKLQEIRNKGALATIHTRPGGYGLYNVDDRIKLYYGEEYGLDIQSEPSAGTVVTLTLPATRLTEEGQEVTHA